jgi:dephospho-CoA kinase
VIVRVIGLTGGIGTGKSAAAKSLAGMGAAVIDADIEGHKAYTRGSIGWRRIVELFGQAVLDDDGEVSRARLGALVFANPQALAWLNSAIHPLIRQQISRLLEGLERSGEGVVIVDAALLYQAGWDDLTDEVWLVHASQAVIMQRLQQRGMVHEDVVNRLAAQGNLDAYLVKADALIENSGTPKQLVTQVQQLWNDRILTKGSTINGRAN